MVRILVIVVALMSVGALNGQSLEFYKNLISQDKDSVLSLLKDSGYTVNKDIPNEGCLGYNLTNNNTTILYNICYYDDGDIINLNLIESNLETAYKRLNEAFNDTTMKSKISTVEANTSFIFENDSLEMFFVFDHFRNIHYMEISNANRYESIKELFESNSGFNSETNGISLMRKILNETNSKGDSLEEILKDSGIRSDFNLLNYEQATKYVVELRNSKDFKKLKKLVDNNLLLDEFYVEKIRKSFVKSIQWLEIEDNYTERFEEGLFKIAMENNQFNSLVMFKYITDSIRNKKND